MREFRNTQSGSRTGGHERASRTTNVQCAARNFDEVPALYS